MVGNEGGTRLRCLGFLSVRRWAFFLFHYDAGSALLGGGLDAFRFLFFIGSFSHCLRRATQWAFARLYEDMMMAFCFLYFLYNPQRF